MKAEEYDELILNPGDFWLRFYIPRLFGAMECMSKLGPITELIEIPTAQLMQLAADPVQEMLEKLLKAGRMLKERLLVANLASHGVASGTHQLIDYYV